MPGNVFGKMFRITTYGESHGKGIGGVIDGCPPNIPMNEDIIQAVLNRRRPGQNVVTSTSRQEPDQAEIFSGTFEGKTTGTPIMIIKTDGRHDVSPIPRINVVCESMTGLVLADHLLRQKAIS